jgi:hypothetical protein
MFSSIYLIITAENAEHAERKIQNQKWKYPSTQPFWVLNLDVLVKNLLVVTPAKAGVQNILKYLDSGFRRNDKFYGISAFYEFINLER